MSYCPYHHGNDYRTPCACPTEGSPMSLAAVAKKLNDELIQEKAWRSQCSQEYCDLMGEASHLKDEVNRLQAELTPFRALLTTATNLEKENLKLRSWRNGLLERVRRLEEALAKLAKAAIEVVSQTDTEDDGPANIDALNLRAHEAHTALAEKEDGV